MVQQPAKRRAAPPFSSPPPQKAQTEPLKSPQTLIVRYLPRCAKAERLEKFFRRYGHVTNFSLCRDKRTGESRCFGFLKFSSHAGATKALAACQEGLAIIRDDRKKAWHVKAEWARKESTDPHDAP